MYTKNTCARVRKLLPQELDLRERSFKSDATGEVFPTKAQALGSKCYQAYVFEAWLPQDRCFLAAGRPALFAPRFGALRCGFAARSPGRGTYVKIKSLGGVNMVKLNKL